MAEASVTNLAQAALNGAAFVYELPEGGTFIQAPARDGTFDWLIVDRDSRPTHALNYEQGEITAWSGGVQNGEFDLPDHLMAMSAAAS